MIEVKMPKLADECRVGTSGYEVFRWPEFIALCARLAIDLGRPIKQFILDLQEDSCSVYVQYRGSDAGPTDCARNLVVDDTTLHNQEWRTSHPVPDESAVNPHVIMINGQEASLE